MVGAVGNKHGQFPFARNEIINKNTEGSPVSSIHFGIESWSWFWVKFIKENKFIKKPFLIVNEQYFKWPSKNLTGGKGEGKILNKV